MAAAAGAGMKSANKAMADSLFFWGVAKIYKYGKAIAATNWQEKGWLDKNRPWK